MVKLYRPRCFSLLVTCLRNGVFSERNVRQNELVVVELAREGDVVGKRGMNDGKACK